MNWLFRTVSDNSSVERPSVQRSRAAGTSRASISIEKLREYHDLAQVSILNGHLRGRERMVTVRKGKIL